MKAPLTPEEILTFLVLNNLDKDYSIEQFLRDRERARSTFGERATVHVKTRSQSDNKRRNHP